MTSQRHQLPIDFSPIFEALEKPLDLIDDPERRLQMERFIANSRAHQEKAVVELIAQLVTTLNEATGVQSSVQVRDGGYLLNLDREALDSEPVFDPDGEIERVTLRLPRQLKTLIDEAAERSGHSTNTWYVRTLSRALAHQMRAHLHNRQEGELNGWGWKGRRRRERGATPGQTGRSE